MRRIFATIAPGAFALGVSLTAHGQATPPRAAQAPAPKSDPAVQRTQQAAPAPAPARSLDPAQAVRLPSNAELQIARKRMDEVLARWEAQSAGIQTLDALFTRTDYSPGWDETINYKGRAILKAPNLAFLDFQQYDPEKKQFAAYEQIRCTGTEVYHYRAPTTQIFVYPLAPDQRQRALEEGPLPFLFNFRADQAKARYEMTMQKETETHYIIRIRPREDIDREAFVLADIQLDKQKFLPSSLMLLAPNGKDKQLYTFNAKNAYIKANVQVADENFQPRLLKNWDVVRNPGPDGRPQSATQGMTPATARAGQPAARR